MKLAYWDYGHGPGALLLIMGVNLRAAHWGPHFLGALAERLRVLCFDNRGTGSSTKPVEELDASLWVGDALAVLDAAGVERASVLGASMGGRIAQQLAVEHPERVDRLVLLSSVMGGPDHVPGTSEAVAGFLPQPDKSPEQIRREAIAACVGPGFVERYPERFEAIVERGASRRTPFRVLRKQLAAARSDLREQLRALDRPILILHGDSDALVPKGNSDQLHAAVPQARYVVLEGVGHLASWEAPERVLEPVLGFLR